MNITHFYIDLIRLNENIEVSFCTICVYIWFLVIYKLCFAYV